MSETPRTDEHLRRKRENGYVVVVSSEFARQLETELAEARAEIDRLNKNMRFATAINLAMQEAGQDLPDLRGHECLAKHKLLSLFDLWRKKVRPRLPGFIDDEISQRDELIEQMRDALKACVEFIRCYGQEHNIGDGKVLEQATFALLVSERASNDQQSP